MGLGIDHPHRGQYLIPTKKQRKANSIHFKKKAISIFPCFMCGITHKLSSSP